MGLFNRGNATGLVSEQPRILVIDDVVTDEECAHLMSLVDGRMRDARIVGEEQGDVIMSKRSAAVGWVHTRQTPEVTEIVARVAELAEMSPSVVEDMQVVRYEVGDQHTLHLDTFDPDEPGGQAQMRNGGQRLRTGLLYLAAPQTGGSTAFPKAKHRVKAKAGRLVLFDTVLPGTTDPDPLALHAGMPVIRGQKWACNIWFRERTPKSTLTRGGSSSKKRKRR